MHRIDNATAAAVLPTPKPPGNPGFFTRGTIGGASPTIVEADFLNTLQEEFVAVVQAAALRLDKTDNTQLLQALTQLVGANTRQRLVADFNLYCDASLGSDLNDGLTPQTAFATPQAAWNLVMGRYDMGGFKVSVNLAHGTYPMFHCDGTLVGARDFGVFFQGDPASPSAVTINGVNGPAIAAGNGAIIGASYLRVQSTSTTTRELLEIRTENPATDYIGAPAGLSVGPTASIWYSNLNFGPCGVHQTTFGGELVSMSDPYSITGAAQAHIESAFGGRVDLAGSHVTITGTPNWSNAFISMQENSVANMWSMVFSGPATGRRFAIDFNASCVIDGTGAVDPNQYLPGSINGVTARGGQIG